VLELTSFPPPRSFLTHQPAVTLARLRRSSRLRLPGRSRAAPASA
jgi:hypothetical protein